MLLFDLNFVTRNEVYDASRGEERGWNKEFLHRDVRDLHQGQFVWKYGRSVNHMHLRLNYFKQLLVQLHFSAEELLLYPGVRVYM